MRVNVLSGYFMEAYVCGWIHPGHREYLLSGNDCDHLVVLIDCPKNFISKYGFEPEYKEITSCIKEVVPRAEVVISDCPTASMLPKIRARFPKEEMYFCKAGDRDWNNLPDDERESMIVNDVFFARLPGDKIASASEDMDGWKKTEWGWRKDFNRTTSFLHAITPLSVQRHGRKTEAWRAMSEEVYLTIKDEFIVLKRGEAILIDRGKLHCLLKGTVYEACDMEDATERVFDWERNR